MGNENTAAFNGVLTTELEKTEHIGGTKKDCRRATLSVERKSGTKDIIEIYCTENTKVVDELPFMQGVRVIVSGRVQTVKDFSTGNILTYVLADFLGTIPDNGDEQENYVKLRGVLSGDIRKHTTKDNKRIAGFFTAVEGAFRDAPVYIPCICWNRKADEAENWADGTEIELLGRLQSREYKLKPEQGGGVRRVHEVCAYELNKI